MLHKQAKWRFIVKVAVHTLTTEHWKRKARDMPRYIIIYSKRRIVVSIIKIPIISIIIIEISCTQSFILIILWTGCFLWFLNSISCSSLSLWMLVLLSIFKLSSCQAFQRAISNKAQDTFDNLGVQEGHCSRCFKNY